ncbi:MAG: heavy metal translocating P-type ATPase, partial [Kineothrix sp.]|nr:heavy metal translocating P-type ATPase [Kineothrix sp.]
MSKKLKKRIKRVGAGAAIYLAAVVFSRFAPVIPVGSFGISAALPIFLAAYIAIGGDVVRKALKNIGHGQIFDENFLMMVATAGAFVVGEYAEAVAVMLFYQVGECFQSYAVNKSRKSIADLMDIRPDYANVIRDGETVEVGPEEVSIGEVILIKPGERIPLDGMVVKGASSLDTMALTGESLPRDVMEGENVISGCVNLSGVLEVKVSKNFGESTVAKILDLVENAGNKKSEAEHFITKFARYYTPIVVGLALLLALIPPLVSGGGWADWIYRALSFLVISCPCALVISIPLSFFGGLGGASREGILIKGSNYLEALADGEIIVMDKTGTLTKGTFVVKKLMPAEGISESVLLETAAYAESFSNHPISKSLMQAYGKEVDGTRLKDVEEEAGHGICAVLDGKRILAGNSRLMEGNGIKAAETEEIGTIVHVAKEKDYLGYIVIADVV